MKGRRPGFTLVTGIIAGIAQFSAISAFACGVEWKVPRNHFDGVNEYGLVSYWKEIGTLDIGEGINFPLIIGFRSDWDRSSPYLGHGWFLGIFDSYFIQRSADSFDLIQPDGYTVPFGRDIKKPSVLNGAKGWKAEIKGDTISVFASCGWKLTFVKGKIASIGTPKNRTLDIQRDAQGVATAVVNGTAVLMKVQRDQSGLLTDLIYGGKAIRLEKVDKPLLQTINGVNVVGSKAPAIGRIVLPFGENVSFDYAPTGELKPAMTVSELDKAPRPITWDASTRIISTDGDWNYQITPSEIPGHNAAIARTNSATGEKESWHYNQSNGEEVSKKAGGTTTIRKWFTSGKLNGKPRSVSKVAGGEETLVRSWSYDENGVLIRSFILMNSPHIFTYRYDERGNQNEIIVDGKSYVSKKYDDSGRVISKTLANGVTKEFEYLKDRIKQTTKLTDGSVVVKELDRNFRTLGDAQNELAEAIYLPKQ